MKKIVILAVFFLAISFFAFAPEERVNYVVSGFKRLTNDPAQICFDYYKNSLKDPSSARITSSNIVTNSYVEVKYRAQNSFGAFIEDTFSCELKNNELDKTKILIKICDADIPLESREENLNCYNRKLNIKYGRVNP